MHQIRETVYDGLKFEFKFSSRAQIKLNLFLVFHFKDNGSNKIEILKELKLNKKYKEIICAFFDTPPSKYFECTQYSFFRYASPALAYTICICECACVRGELFCYVHWQSLFFLFDSY